MDLTCGSLIHHCDDMMETLFDEDSGLGMDFDFRNVSIQNKSFQIDIEVEISNNRFNPATIFACSKPGAVFTTSYVVVFFCAQ